MDLIVETSEDMFSAQGVKVNRRIQPLFKEGVSMWAELENKWVLNKQKGEMLLFMITLLSKKQPSLPVCHFHRPSWGLWGKPDSLSDLGKVGPGVSDSTWWQ